MSQKSQRGQSHASISSEHGAPLSPKGERRLLFCQCFSSHLQEADKAVRLCRSVDVTDVYRHVHPLWSESIIQPKMWVRFSDSTCNSTEDHSKKKKTEMRIGHVGCLFSQFCFLFLPSTIHITHVTLQKSFPCCPTQKDSPFREGTEKLLSKSRDFLSQSQGLAHFNVKAIAPSKKKSS